MGVREDLGSYLTYEYQSAGQISDEIIYGIIPRSLGSMSTNDIRNLMNEMAKDGILKKKYVSDDLRYRKLSPTEIVRNRIGR